MNEKKEARLNRIAKIILLIFALATPPMFFSAYRAIKVRNNKVEDWLPETYRETDELIWFRKHFVGDQFIVASWKGCELGDNPLLVGGEEDDPRIERLAKYLVPPNKAFADDAGRGKVETTDNRKQYFTSVTTGRRVLNQLTSDATDLSYSRALSRLKGSLIGPDGKQTCLIITLSDDAVVELRKVIGRGISGWLQFEHQEGALQQAMRACDIDPEHAYLGGPPVDSVAIDEEGEKSLYRLATLAALVGFGLSWISLRSIRLTLVVFACGILSAIASLAVVWVSGGTTDAFLLSMPSLVFVLSVSGAVHLIKYYRDAVPKFGVAGAPVRAIIEGWKPTLLCSVTTAIGLLALCTSDLAPIRKFGTYSSAGVFIMLLMLFLFLPAALQVWPPKTEGEKSKRRHLLPDWSKRYPAGILDHVWQTLGGWIISHYVAVTVACGLFIVVLGAGISQVTTNIDIMNLFNNQARVRQDYRWLEANLGRLVPIEVVVRFDDQMQENCERSEEFSALNFARYSFVERAKTIAQIQLAIDQEFGKRGQDIIGRPMSAVTFMPPLPKSRENVLEAMQIKLFDSRLKESFPQLADAGYLAREDDGTELWRISVRVAAFANVDYAEFTGQLKEVVAPLVQRHNEHFAKEIEKIEEFPASVSARENNGNSSLSVVYTGVIPIIYKAQRALLESLMQSAFWSFITITPLLILVSRGIGRGLIAMIPNCLPVLVVFGGLGWLDIPVTIGSMMSASIALGVAVDDTIHYLVWFREELKTNSNRHQASLAAYRLCATPTLQAALISGLGLAVFGLSNFTATRQFGLLMLVILITGVVAELVMLPALLAGPLGKAFEPGNSKNTTGQRSLADGLKLTSPDGKR